MSENKSESLKNHFLEKILNPKSICVFGANNNLMTTMGSMQLRNIIAGGGFDGNIYPVHPRLEKVQGIQAYKTIFDIPIIPDLAFIILPTKIVPQVMEECGQKGVKHLIITSGGFREIGADGIELSKQIDEIAKKYNIRFIGPNCLGIYNGWYGYPDKQDNYFNTFWIYKPHKRGNISLISQSGTVAAQTAFYTNELGIKIGKSISVGNERNIDLVDVLHYFKNDPQTEVIGLYIEEIKRGKDFIRLAKSITPKKPIVAIYAGGTKAAARSIMSHTGSISSDHRIYEAAFKETGIISTNLIMDFLFYLRTLSQAQSYNFFPKGNRVGIITDSGGPGAMMTKSSELYGLEVPEFSQELQAIIKIDIPKTASSVNPIDITFHNNFTNVFIKFPKLLMKSNEVDAVIVFGVYDFDDLFDIIEKSGMKLDDMMKKRDELYENIISKSVKRFMRKYSKPLFFAGPFPYRYRWMQKFVEDDIPIFSMWDDITKCLSILYRYAEYRKNSNPKSET